MDAFVTMLVCLTFITSLVSCIASGCTAAKIDAVLAKKPKPLAPFPPVTVEDRAAESAKILKRPVRKRKPAAKKGAKS